MFRSLLKTLAGGIRWFFFVLTILLLIEELIRVPSWVAGTWGIGHALVDGAVLYKLGEALLLLPFLVFVHFNGKWGADRAAAFARRTRWAMWAGGLLALAAYFDLRGRVLWSWWMFGTVALALLLPRFMRWAAGRRAVRRGYLLATSVVVLVLLLNLFSALTNGGAIAPLPASYPSPAATGAERWQQDLDYLVENLELLHANAYHSVSRERFAEEAARLRAAIPGMSEAEIRVGLTRLVARIGDGHTDVAGWNSREANRYPVRFYLLSDGLFVIAAPETEAAILGGRVLRLNRTDADSALAAARSMVPAETEGHVALLAARYLANADVLEALGIADPDGGLPLAVATAGGDTITTRLETGRQLLQAAPDPPPAFRANPEKQYWSRFDDEARTAYLKYNTFLDPFGLAQFSAGFWSEVEKRNLRYVIVDFRENGGGMSSAFDPFFDGILDHDAIDRRGHLYVLVNRRTFSSAVLYTGILRSETQALVAGEEMGGEPNAFGDLRRFRLPNSGLRITFSRRYFEMWPDTLPPFAIDIPVEVSSGQYFAGEDPVLDEVMSRIRADQEAAAPATPEME